MVTVWSQSECNAYRCVTCRQTEELKTCSGCRLISFCSKNCQTLNWKEHKEFCHAVQKIIGKDGKKSVFESVKLDDGTLDDYKNKIFMKRIETVKRILPKMLGRNLDYKEHLVSL